MVKRLGPIVNAVEDDCHERKRLARFIAITQSLCQQQITQLLALKGHAHSQPSEDCNRQRSSRQFSSQIRGQVTKINLPCRQRVEAGDRSVLIDKHSRGREPLVLMLQCLSVQPIVDLALATIKSTPLMTSLQRFEGEPQRQDI